MKALKFLWRSLLRCSGVGSEGRNLTVTGEAEGSGGNGESEVLIKGSE